MSWPRIFFRHEGGVDLCWKILSWDGKVAVVSRRVFNKEPTEEWPEGHYEELAVTVRGEDIIWVNTEAQMAFGFEGFDVKRIGYIAS